MVNRIVYLVRHGDTAANADTAGPELERGWKGYPLDAEGRSEAKLIAARLAKFGVRAVVSSDLPRAKQTADIISDWLGITPTFDPGLRTWNTGLCAGQVKSKVEPHINNLARHHPDESCSGGESFNEFCDRLFKAIPEVLRRHTENSLAIIIHARVERLWAATEGFSARKVDVDTFLAKPEEPGHIEKWTVSPSVLSSVSRKSPKASVSAAASANTSRGGNVTTLRSR